MWHLCGADGKLNSWAWDNWDIIYESENWVMITKRGRHKANVTFLVQKTKFSTKTSLFNKQNLSLHQILWRILYMESLMLFWKRFSSFTCPVFIHSPVMKQCLSCFISYEYNVTERYYRVKQECSKWWMILSWRCFSYIIWPRLMPQWTTFYRNSIFHHHASNPVSIMLWRDTMESNKST